jgi:hypothetical protein
MIELENARSILRKFEPFLLDLTRHELLVLNKMVVERLRLIDKADDCYR